MKPVLLPLIVVATLALAVKHCGPLRAGDSSAAEAPASTPTERVQLFDGKTLGDCYTWLKDTKRDDPRKVFSVEDGLLHVSGDGLGGLLTNERYRDYHLVLEFKWGQRVWQPRQHAARDSGLLIHSNGVDGGFRGTWMPSIEVQVMEGAVGDFIVVTGDDEAGKPAPLSITCAVEKDRDGEPVWSATGKQETFNAANWRRVNWFGRDADWKDVKDFRGARDVESPHGQWTRIDVFADRGHVEVFVNGTKVNEAFEVSPQAGRIQLQTELAEIFFRRWELWPIGEGPKPAPAVQ